MTPGHLLGTLRSACLDIIDRIHGRGAKGIILSRKGIPLIVNQTDRPSIPLFDAMALDVKAAVERTLAC